MARTKDRFPSPIETFGNYTPQNAPRMGKKCSGALNQRARGMTFLRESTPRIEKKYSGGCLYQLTSYARMGSGGIRRNDEHFEEDRDERVPCLQRSY